MLNFLLKRLFAAIPTLFTIILLVFLLVHAAPGNPFQEEKAVSPQVMEYLLHHYRLDLPLWKQFLYYMNDLLHGSFGESYKFMGQSINSLIFPDYMGGFWVTLQLSIYAMGMAIPLGVLLGSYAGFYQNSWFDKLVVALSMIFNAMPTFVTGPLMVLVFAVILGWLPASDWGGGDVVHLILPVTVLALSYFPTIAFVTRGTIVDVLNANFIRTARAKGLPMRQILFKHAIRPTLIPVVSLLGPMFAAMLVGAMVTEKIFALPGLGVLTTNAATNRDYNLVLGLTIFGSFLTIFFNVLVDLLYFFLDPKIKP